MIIFTWVNQNPRKFFYSFSNKNAFAGERSIKIGDDEVMGKVCSNLKFTMGVGQGFLKPSILRAPIL